MILDTTPKIGWHDVNGNYVTTGYEECLDNVIKNWSAVDCIIPKSKYEDNKSYFENVAKKTGYVLWRTKEDKQKGRDYLLVFRRDRL